jgi:hypothetical protein
MVGWRASRMMRCASTSTIRQDVTALRGEVRGVGIQLRGEIQGVERRLRVLIEQSRDESRAMFDGLRAILERMDSRIEEMNTWWKSTDAEHVRLLRHC